MIVIRVYQFQKSGVERVFFHMSDETKETINMPTATVSSHLIDEKGYSSFAIANNSRSFDNSLFGLLDSLQNYCIALRSSVLVDCTKEILQD
jgi:hypothetical protein